uniref:Uncharacterized protein n=1 Tax=Solanum lycopersicum TaxID=4081 RepID=A0A494G9X6_SOLLC
MVGNHAVPAHKSSHLHRIGIVGIALRHIERAAANFPVRHDAVAGPGCGGVLRRIGRHLVLRVGRNAVLDHGVEIRVAGKHLPLWRDAAGHAGAEAIDLDLAGQRVGGGVDLAARIVLGDAEDRRCQRQVAIHHIPLAASLVRLVLFGIQRLLSHRAHQLFERRIERCAVRDVVRLLLGRLPDATQPHAREVDRLIGVGQRGVAGGIARVDRVADAGDVLVVTQPGHGLPLFRKFDRVVGVHRHRIGRSALEISSAGSHAARRVAIDRIHHWRAGDVAGCG